MNPVIKTDVVMKIHSALDSSLSSGEMIALIGEAQTGIICAAAAWANTHPVTAKIGAIPCGNSLHELQMQIARIYEIEKADVPGYFPASVWAVRVKHALAAKRIFPIFNDADGFWRSVCRCEWWRHMLVDARVPHAIILTAVTTPVEESIVHKVIAKAYRVCRLPDERETP